MYWDMFFWTLTLLSGQKFSIKVYSSNASRSTCFIRKKTSFEEALGPFFSKCDSADNFSLDNPGGELAN